MTRFDYRTLALDAGRFDYRTLALDAGKNKVYGALGYDRRLVALHAFDPNHPADHLAAIELCVLEKVNINENTPNWQSTLDCGLSGERVAGRHRCSIDTYTPAQWKGGVKKPTHHLLMWDILDPEERRLFHRDTEDTIRLAAAHVARTGRVKNYSFEEHNFLDAAALLMFEFKRLGRGGARIR